MLEWNSCLLCLLKISFLVLFYVLLSFVFLLYNDCDIANTYCLFRLDYTNNQESNADDLLNSRAAVNKTTDVTVPSTVWDGMHHLQETVTPSPVKTIDANTISDENLAEQLEGNVEYANKTEKLEQLKQDTDGITELKADVPNVDKFVKAGKKLFRISREIFF